MKPSVGRIVHYVSHGTPLDERGQQAYASTCRAAIVTKVWAEPAAEDGSVPPARVVGLAVLNPEGMFFNREVAYHDGAGQPGSPDCLVDHANMPFRYCACGWTEDAHRGGTWHWPERES